MQPLHENIFSSVEYEQQKSKQLSAQALCSNTNWR